METITFEPIGTNRSPHTRPEETPIQPVYAKGIEGSAEIRPEFAEGLRDLEEFSHIMLLYHFHRAGSVRMTVTPFLDDQPRGLFATCAPNRPNGIGMSVVRLLAVEGSVLRLSDLDILDGTPLLDIKPLVPRFDLTDELRGGWHARIDEETARKRGKRGWRG